MLIKKKQVLAVVSIALASFIAGSVFNFAALISGKEKEKNEERAMTYRKSEDKGYPQHFLGYVWFITNHTRTFLGNPSAAAISYILVEDTLN